MDVTWENLWTIEGLVAAGTLLLAGATAWLAYTAKGQVKVAADHVVAIQRPLVTPFMPPRYTQGMPRGPTIGLRNIGLGPAYSIEGGLYWTGGAGGASSLQRTTLGAGEETEAGVIGEGINIVWPNASGFLRYRDSAGVEWQTHFRYRVVPTAIEVEIVEVGTTSDLGEPRYSGEGRAETPG